MAKNRLTVDTVVCKGCILCVPACPLGILAVDKETVNAKGYNPVKCTDMDACTGCAMCAMICPDSAIRLEREV
ncbi:MAG: 4Fe-4S dicluster domain-containing protein [Oscillospiraceae bacterium]|nr:4Fe-4S dicluster domain-containing protein [Oscillospiraceae bacterium]